MIKIIHLITDLGSGGAERMLCRLVSESRSDDVQYIVVSMLDEGVYGDKIKSAGIKLITLNMKRGRPSLGGLLRLVKLLKQEKPDVVQTWLYHADLLGTIASYMAGVGRVVWNVRCSDMDMSRYSFLSKAVLWLLVRLSSRIDGVVVNSKAGRKTHEAMGYRPKKWEIIANGFDMEEFKPDSTGKINFRASIGALDEQIIFGLIARLDPMKDHPTFLDAAAEVIKHNVTAQFVLVGEGCEQGGALEAELSNRGIGQNIKLLGLRDDIANIMSGLDVCVLSSAFGEGFPNVIGEAMATGVPAVATDVGDSREIVGDTGEIVAPGNANALAAAMVHMINMGDDGRVALGRAARERIAKNYSISAITLHYKTYYHSLVEG